MRRAASFLTGIPLKIVAAQDKTLTVFVKGLDETRLHAGKLRTKRSIETDADVAGTRLQTMRTPGEASSLEIKAGEEIPGNSRVRCLVLPLHRPLLEQLSWNSIFHRNCFHRSTKIVMYLPEVSVVVISNA